jgi:hypothetical protein
MTCKANIVVSGPKESIDFFMKETYEYAHKYSYSGNSSCMLGCSEYRVYNFDIDRTHDIELKISITPFRNSSKEFYISLSEKYPDLEFSCGFYDTLNENGGNLFFKGGFEIHEFCYEVEGEYFRPWFKVNYHDQYQDYMLVVSAYASSNVKYGDDS